MRHPGSVLLAMALAVGLLAAGCGGDPFADTEPSATTAPPITVPPSSPLTLPSALVSSRVYVDAPSDVTLTAPGSALDVKDKAVVGWAPRTGFVAVLKLKVAKLETTTVEKAFAGYQVDDDTAASTPYFVHLVATNVGDTDLGGLVPPVYVEDTDDDLVEPTGFANSFVPCPDPVLPTPFPPGEKATLCLVYLAPKGTTLSSVLFQPPVGVAPITWSGNVTQARHLGDGSGGKNHGGGR